MTDFSKHRLETICAFFVVKIDFVILYIIYYVNKYIDINVTRNKQIQSHQGRY